MSYLNELDDLHAHVWLRQDAPLKRKHINRLLQRYLVEGS